MQFMGYKRPYGRVGVRNHVVVMPGVLCSDVAARRVADAVDGVKYLFNPQGCPDNKENVIEVMSGLLANPNVYAALIIGNGCETVGKAEYLDAIEKKSPGKRVEYISIQGEGGLGKAILKGCDIVRSMLIDASKCQREPCDISELMLGLECGGSDPTSGLSANAALGLVSDRLADLGAATVISETSEAIGAEHILRARGNTPEIGDAIYNAICHRANVFAEAGMDIRDSNPSAGNIRSGLTTLEEKSLGCINKSGSRPFMGYYEYGQLVTTKGANFMDTAAYDPTSTAAEIAGGCQIVCFTSGMGNPMGNAIAPVVKITGNHGTAQRLDDIIDFDTSATLRGEKQLKEVGDELFDLILEVANGRPTLAEMNQADTMLLDQYIMCC